MAERNIKSRIVHKHDTAEHWSLATGFIPKQGEIIIYDVDDTYDYERIKIGDGVTNVNSLPFSNDSIVESMNTQISGLQTSINNVSNLVGDTSVASQINTAIANKVDKVAGKDLSTNDYTDEDKAKLNGIAEGAEVNVQADWNIHDSGNMSYINNRPCYDSIKKESIHFSIPGSNTLNSATGLYVGERSSTIPLTVGDRYDIYINSIYITTTTCVSMAQSGTSYTYLKVLGNTKLGADLGYINNSSSSHPVSDTGEDYCLIAYSSTSKTIFIHKIQGQEMSLYHVTGELKQLDEKYIPDTIARTSSIDAITNDEIDKICGSAIYSASEVEY